jgi:hypothetical protein
MTFESVKVRPNGLRIAIHGEPAGMTRFRPGNPNLLKNSMEAEE